MPGSASSRRPARCGPSSSCGTRSPSSATASTTPRCGGSATASRSTRSASPRRSPRTTCSGSCSRCSGSPCRRTPGPAPSSCPAWNEALGLPRPWDQQWSLRLQQVLAFESDLLEYDDIFDGSHVIEAKVAELVDGARAEIDRVQAMGGAIAAVESGYMKQALVSSHAARRARIESGEDIVVGVNKLRDHRAVAADRRPRRRHQGRRPGGRAVGAASVEAWKAQRDEAEVAEALAPLAADAKTDANLMARHPGRRPAPAPPRGSGPARCARCSASSGRPPVSSGAVGVAEAGAELTAVRERVKATGEELGGPAAAAGRQARSRRALQRRRAGRRPGPRRRLRGDLPGHPADPGADRGRGRRRGRALRGALDPLRLAHGARPRRARRPARGRAGDVPVIVGGIIPESDGRRLPSSGSPRSTRPRTSG